MTKESDNQLLNKELDLISYFKEFPYLQRIGLDLVERRFSEPHKKIIDIFNDELIYLKEERKEKVLHKKLEN